MAQELEARQRTALGGLGAATEPELDQFMVSYQLTVTDPLSAKEEIFLRFCSRGLFTHGGIICRCFSTRF